MTRSEAKSFKEVHGAKAYKEAVKAERNEKRSKRAEKAREKQILADNRKRSFRTGLSIAKIAMLLCLFVIVMRFFTFPDRAFSVESLLVLFESIEPIDVELLYDNLFIVENWGFFNFFRDFLNFLAGFWSFVGSIGNALATILQFWVRLLQYVYGVV